MIPSPQEYDRLGELLDALWEAIAQNPTGWDALEEVVKRGLESWPESELIDEAERFRIDVSAYKEGDDA